MSRSARAGRIATCRLLATRGAKGKAEQGYVQRSDDDVDSDKGSQAFRLNPGSRRAAASTAGLYALPTARGIGD
jgi:hypothetical protein